MSIKPIHLFDLPQEIFEKIVDYVPFTDIKSLASTNKALKNFLQSTPNYHAKQIYHTIIQCSSKMDNSWSISGFEGYHIPSEQELSKIERAEEFLQERTHCTHQLGSFLGEWSANEKLANSFLKKVWRILLDPMLPEPILKRDIHNFETESYYQTFLTDFYHGILLPPRKDANRDFMNNFVQSLPDPEVHSDTVKWMRWYNIEKLMELDESQENPLVKFYVKIIRFFTVHSRILASYLNSISDDQTFLKEYIRTWKEYQLSCQEFHHLFSALSEKIHNVYEKVFPEHFQYPKFAFWRLFTKIFIQEVYNRLAERVNRAYHETFARRLVDKILKSDLHSEAKQAIMMVTQQEEFEGEVPEKCDFIIKHGMVALEDISLNEYSVFFNQLENSQALDFAPKRAGINKAIEAMEEALTSVLSVVDATRDLRAIMNVLEDYFVEVFNLGTSNRMSSQLYGFVEKVDIEKHSTLKSLLEDKLLNIQETEVIISKKIELRQARGYVEIKEEYKPYFNLMQAIDPDFLYESLNQNQIENIQNDRIICEV